MTSQFEEARDVIALLPTRLLWTKPPDMAVLPVEDPWYENFHGKPGDGRKVRIGHVNVREHMERIGLQSERESSNFESNCMQR